MKNNRGFTLIELLAVLIIMVIVLGIGIPSVIKIIEDRSSDEYNIQLKLVKNGLVLYQDRYKNKFEQYKDKSCLILDYQTNLIDEGLVEEKDVTCSGKIILNRKKEGVNSFNYVYYLNCVDQARNYTLSNNASSFPTNSGCTDIINSEPATISNIIEPPTIKSNATGNTWQTSQVDVELDGTADSNYTYQYYISDNPVIPSNTVTVQQVPSTNKVELKNSGSYYVWFRKKSNEPGTNLVSNWSNMVEVNIDKETPSLPTISASDGIANNQVHTENFVLVVSGGNNLSGNTYKYGFTSNPTEDLTDGFYEYDLSTQTTATKTFYVKACSKAAPNKCGQVASYIIKK